MVTAYNSCGAGVTNYKKIVLPYCLPPIINKIVTSTGSYDICDSVNTITLHTEPVCPTCSYNWTYNNTTINTTNLTVDPRLAKDFTVTASNGCLPNTTAWQSLSLHQTVTPSVLIVQHCLDTAIILYANVTNGGSNPTFIWQKLQNNQWQTIDTINWSTGIYLSNIANETPIKCILNSNEFCKSSDSVSANLTINCESLDYDNISISPNPNYGYIYVKARLRKPQLVSIAVYNNIGKLVLTKKIYNLTNFLIQDVTLPNISAGNYFVVASFDDKKTVKSLIVVK